MPKGSSKSTAAIQRLLEERRQYEAWLARINAAGDAAPEHVRVRGRGGHEARLQGGNPGGKAHAGGGGPTRRPPTEIFPPAANKEKGGAGRTPGTRARHPA